MNQTTSGCGNCYYYFNGQCTIVGKCPRDGVDTVTTNHTISINEAYNQSVGINECGSNLPDDIINNLPDGIINILPDDIIGTPNFAKPNNGFRINYDVQVGVFYCAICGTDIPWFEGQNPNKVRVCNECKQAIAWAKEKMKEKEDGRIST